MGNDGYYFLGYFIIGMGAVVYLAMICLGIICGWSLLPQPSNNKDVESTMAEDQINTPDDNVYIPIFADDGKTVIRWLRRSREYVGTIPEEDGYDDQ